MFAAAGLVALVAASEVAFLVLRVVGAGFLRYLGFKAWRSAWRSRASATARPADEAPVDSATGWMKAFGQGVLVMLANPKAAAS